MPLTTVKNLIVHDHELMSFYDRDDLLYPRIICVRNVKSVLTEYSKVYIGTMIHQLMHQMCVCAQTCGCCIHCRTYSAVILVADR